jgi:hypothetical protein
MHIVGFIQMIVGVAILTKWTRERKGAHLSLMAFAEKAGAWKKAIR